MAADPYVRIRQRFGEIVAEANRTATAQNDCKAQTSNTGRRPAEEKYLELCRKKKALAKDIGNFENKEYYRLAHHEDLTGILYFSRFTCPGRDDEKAVRQGIHLYENEKHIDSQLIKLKKELKPTSFEDYLAGHTDQLIHELDGRPPGMSEKDYEQLCAWQTAKKISCIKPEFEKLRENFKNAVKDEIFTGEIIQNEIRLLESIFSNGSLWKTPRLISELQKLKGLAGILLPEDLQEFHRLFELFLQGNNLDYLLTTSYFERAKNNIESSRASGMPVFCYSLLMYCRWLHHIACFKADVFDKDESSYDNLFIRTYEEGIKNKDSCIKRFEEANVQKSLKASHYELLLLQALEKQRKIFNNLEFPHYINHLDEKEKLKNSFVNDCLRSLNVELPKEELRKAIMLNENIEWLTEKMCVLKHNPILPAAKQIKDNAFLLEILCHMAPDSHTINRFLDGMQLIKEQISNDRIPMYFINENAIGFFHKVWEEARRNFKKLVEKMDIIGRGCFIANLLRELNYLENAHHAICRKKIIFFKDIMLLLKNELSSVEKIYSFQSNESMDNTRKNETPDNKRLSFGYRPGPKDIKVIMSALQLCIHLFKDEKDVDDFIAVFTSPDWSSNKRTFKLACQTNQFKYVMEHLEDYSTNFNPASIEKSGLFISKKGKPITANCLNVSSTDTLKRKHAIDNIFGKKR